MRLLPSIAAFFFLTALGFSADQAPERISEHYDWCLQPKDFATKVARLETFYGKHHPKNEEYADPIDFWLVRAAAYNLAEFYNAAGNQEKVKLYLDWLEKTDETLR